jgi:hypothetical protein
MTTALVIRCFAILCALGLVIPLTNILDASGLEAFSIGFGTGGLAGLLALAASR